MDAQTQTEISFSLKRKTKYNSDEERYLASLEHSRRYREKKRAQKAIIQGREPQPQPIPTQ